jgi:hypothetical protein
MPNSAPSWIVISSFVFTRDPLFETTWKCYWPVWKFKTARAVW